MSEFEGLVAAVTGGASGIGKAVATLLAERGAQVAVLDLKPDDTGFRCDVSSDDEVREAIDAVVDRFGRLDILVNNAGIGAQGDVAANDDDEWHRVFDVNVVGMVRLARAALPHLKNSPSAAIVNTCSIAAWAGLPNRALYSASKGAVLSLTLAMATDHLPDRIRVNCVCPGHGGHPLGGPAARRRRRPGGRTRGPRGAPADGPAGHRRRGRERHRLPRQPPFRFDHRHRARGRRRHVRPAPARPRSAAKQT